MNGLNNLIFYSSYKINRFIFQILALGLPLLPETLSTIPPFSSIALNSGNSNGTASGDNCKPEVAKTGLGSSAAMTASVVAAILHYLGAISLPILDSNRSRDNATNSGLDLVHAIAQSAHCMAQGKIGSGFDVSASVYGSQRYIRFSPTILSSAQVYSHFILVFFLIKNKNKHVFTLFVCIFTSFFVPNFLIIF